LIRRILIATALVALIAPQTFAGTWLKTVAEAQKVAQQQNQLILVDMFADWCGWCHRFEREVFPSAAFQNATTDLVLLRLDTEDQAEGTRFARKYAVTSLPTFLLLSPDLSLAGTIRGYAPANQFVLMLAETRAKHDAFLNRVRNEAKLAKDYPQRLQLAKEFTARTAYDKAETRLRSLTTETGVPAEVRDEAYYDLALNYLMQDRLDDGLKTIRAFTTISRSGPLAERARILASQILIEQGNFAAAATELRSFKKSYPNSPLVSSVDQMLPDVERRLAAGKR
jgi:thioredoxin-related protein